MDIEALFKKFDCGRLVAFDSQKKFVDSIQSQYKEKGYLSEKQIEVLKRIIDQNENFSRSFRCSMALEH